MIFRKDLGFIGGKKVKKFPISTNEKYQYLIVKDNVLRIKDLRSKDNVISLYNLDGKSRLHYQRKYVKLVGTANFNQYLTNKRE
jgi:hypothetical protein